MDKITTVLNKYGIGLNGDAPRQVNDFSFPPKTLYHIKDVSLFAKLVGLEFDSSRIHPRIFPSIFFALWYDNGLLFLGKTPFSLLNILSPDEIEEALIQFSPELPLKLLFPDSGVNPRNVVYNALDKHINVFFKKVEQASLDDLSKELVSCFNGPIGLLDIKN